MLESLLHLKSDPSILISWTREQCLQMVHWLCAVPPEVSAQRNQELAVLHCLFTCGKISINDTFRCPDSENQETALSLAVAADNPVLVRYLLKMGASPDVLVGWDARARGPHQFAFDRIPSNSDGYHRLLLQYCQIPTRSSVKEVLLIPSMEMSEFIQCVADHQMLDQFTPGVEYDVVWARADPQVVETWSRLHCAYLYERLVRRRPCGPISSDFSVIKLLLSRSGKVSVNDNLVGSGFERITALHEAVGFRNLDFVRYLLQRHKANPNYRCYVDGMPWNDITHIVYPLSGAMRAFLVWDELEADTVKQILDLLVDAGTRQDVQIETIESILDQEVMVMMDLTEAMHFIRMVERLASRDIGIITHMQRSLTAAIPVLLGACEQKWLKNSLADSPQTGPRFEQLVSVGIHLIQVAVRAGCPYTSQEILLDLISNRSYLTFGALVFTFGNQLNLLRSTCGRIRSTDLFTDEHAAAGLTRRDVNAKDALRVGALITIIIRSTVASQRWIPLLRFLRAVILSPASQVMLPVFSLKNLCIGVVNDLLRNGQFKHVPITSLPVTLQSELVMEREFDVLCDIVL